MQGPNREPDKEEVVSAYFAGELLEESGHHIGSSVDGAGDGDGGGSGNKRGDGGKKDGDAVRGAEERGGEKRKRIHRQTEKRLRGKREGGRDCKYDRKKGQDINGLWRKLWLVKVSDGRSPDSILWGRKKGYEFWNLYIDVLKWGNMNSQALTK